MFFQKVFQRRSLLVTMVSFFLMALQLQSMAEEISPAPVAAADEDPQWGKSPPIEGVTTVLRGLHKGTARIFALKVPHGKVVKFGTLKIIVRACRHNPPDEKPENAAFVEIFEQKTPEVEDQVFSGWMFGSSPSLSTLEHPTYDIWVTDCLSSPSQASPSQASPSQEPSSQAQKTSISTAH